LIPYHLIATGFPDPGTPVFSRVEDNMEKA